MIKMNISNFSKKTPETGISTLLGMAIDVSGSMQSSIRRKLI